jgi:hydroxymethylglutaryl-CoA synthase
MVKIGIDRIFFYTTNRSISLKTLATKRNIPEEKYLLGLGQESMSIITPQEDIVTMACNAAKNIEDVNNIDLLLFATESSNDSSKAAGIACHKLLGIKPECRTIEIKQACYSSTAALQIAQNYINSNHNARVLILCSDVAWYGLRTPGEPTQGCGSVAMLISKNPKIASINNQSLFITQDNNDFFRPITKENPIVDGKNSIKCYLNLANKLFNQYNKKYNANIDKFCFHLPFARMAQKVTNHIMIKYPEHDPSTYYTQKVGNIYTGSLYLSLLSLLENTQENLSNNTIGMLAYGSGSTAEFFTLTIEEEYTKYLNPIHHNNIIKNSIQCNYEEYENLWKIFQIREKSENFTVEIDQNTKFQLVSIENYIRYYQQI